MKIAYDQVKPGDRVTIKIPAGKGIRNGKIVQEWANKTGKCVFIGDYGPVLNMGGRHGIPAVAIPDVFVSARR